MAQRRQALGKAIADAVAEHTDLERDAEAARLRAENATLKAKYTAALRRIDAERERADALAGLKGLRAHVPTGKPRKPARHRATTPFRDESLRCDSTSTTAQDLPRRFARGGGPGRR